MRKSGGQIEENLLQPHLQKKQRIIEFLDEEEEQERFEGKKDKGALEGDSGSPGACLTSFLSLSFLHSLVEKVLHDLQGDSAVLQEPEQLLPWHG